MVAEASITYTKKDVHISNGMSEITNMCFIQTSVFKHLLSTFFSMNPSRIKRAGKLKAEITNNERVVEKLCGSYMSKGLTLTFKRLKYSVFFR